MAKTIKVGPVTIREGVKMSEDEVRMRFKYLVNQKELEQLIKIMADDSVGSKRKTKRNKRK